MFEDLKFEGTWRSYQQKVLDNLEEHLADKKLQIVAAPGAGKTILGLEVIRRIGKPCLILAPTITIKNQWELRLKQLFLKKQDISDSFISTDILNPKTITISTYQGLLAGLCGHKENENLPDFSTDSENPTKVEKEFSRLDVKKAEALIKKLKEKNIDLLCLDEAHHLRRVWWKSLDYIMKNLRPSTTLSLTATPPYDVDLNEWKRYEELCGPIDESISIPELVKNGDLCPHQDLIYFAPLREEEEESQNVYQQNAQSFYLDFLSDKDFANEAFQLGIWKNPRKYLELLFDDPDFYIAFASYLNYHHFPLPEAFFKLFDTKQEALPEFNLIQAENLINKLFYKYKEVFSSLKEYIDSFHQKAQKLHLVYNGAFYLSGNPKMTKEMARSLGKLDAIENIVISESRQLKEKLRLVVLADYIKLEAFSSQVEMLGVIPIFIRLAKAQLKNMHLCVLTGKIILLPQDKKDALKRAMKGSNLSEGDITFKTLKYNSDYVEVNLKESVKSKIVHLITKLFNEGELNILVGTHSLLGEGWDAPSVNSLILSSTVASYMLSNQMRGRAIRTEQGNPDKVSHIWHLISVRTYDFSDKFMSLMILKTLIKDEEDFERVKRRFEGYEAPELKDPYTIQNGIERCLNEKMSVFYKKMTDKDHLATLTKQMLSYSRAETKKAWKDGLFCGTGMGVGHLNVGLETPEIKNKSFCYIDGYIAKLVAAGTIAYSILNGLSEHLSSTWNLGVLTLGCVGFLGYMLPSTLRVIRTGKPEGILKQISLVILETLFKMDIISTNPKMSSLEVRKTSDVGYYVSSGTLSQRDNNIFIQSLSEFLNPIENPRYLLIRKNPILRFFKQVDYYAIPSIIGLNKRNVLIFKEIWQKRIGYCNIVYTRTETGHEMLLKARMKAYSNLQNQTRKLNKWE